MKMTRLSGLAIAGLMGTSLLACGGGSDVGEFVGYGTGHPGAGLPLGGEIYLNRVKTPDGPANDIQAYFYTWSETPHEPVDFPAPGQCHDFSGAYPLLPDDRAQYVDLGPEVTLTGGGKTLTAPQVLDGVDTNWLQHDIMYQTFGIPDGDITMGEYYDIAFDGSEDLNPAELYLGDDFEITEPAIGVAPVTLTRGQPLTVKWELVDQTNGGEEHTADRTFAFIALWTNDASTYWYCPLNDAEAATRDEFTIPAEVIDSLPEEGTIQMGAPTHEMAAFMGKRVDMYGIACAISPFSF